MPPRSDRRREGGFTLIEVLAAVLIVCLVFGLLLESVTRNLADLARARQEARGAQAAEDRLRDLQAGLDNGDKLEDGVKEEPCLEPDTDLVCQTIVVAEKLNLPADYPGELPPSPLFTAANEPPRAPRPAAPGGPAQEAPLRLLQVRAYPPETDPNTVDPYVVLLVAPPDAQAQQQLQQLGQQKQPGQQGQSPSGSAGQPGAGAGSRGRSSMGGMP